MPKDKDWLLKIIKQHGTDLWIKGCTKAETKAHTAILDKLIEMCEGEKEENNHEDEDEFMNCETRNAVLQELITKFKEMKEA